MQHTRRSIPSCPCLRMPPGGPCKSRFLEEPVRCGYLLPRPPPYLQYTAVGIFPPALFDSCLARQNGLPTGYSGMGHMARQAARREFSVWTAVSCLWQKREPWGNHTCVWCAVVPSLVVLRGHRPAGRRRHRKVICRIVRSQRRRISEREAGDPMRGNQPGTRTASPIPARRCDPCAGAPGRQAGA